MSNLNHANDKNKAPLCDLISNGNQFKNKMHYLKNLLRLVELSYEGFYCSQRYSHGELNKPLQDEGRFQQNFYIQIYDEALSALDHLFEDMRANTNLNMEGK